MVKIPPHPPTQNDCFIEQFRDAMHNAGIHIQEPIIADGEIHRFHIKGDKTGTLNGWYVLDLDGDFAFGAFGHWVGDIKHNWHSKKGRSLSVYEQRTIDCKLKEAAQLREQEKQRKTAAAEKEAQAIHSGLLDAQHHPYLERKSVKAHAGTKVSEDGGFVIPIISSDDKITSLQTVYANGGKRFMKDGRIKSCYFPIGTPSDTLYICEGYATAASIHEAMGGFVIVAFNSGNLKDVALVMREKYPSADITICADNDIRHPENIGLKKAEEAAILIDAHVAFPEFPVGSQGTDFNDLHQEFRLEAVKEAIAQKDLISQEWLDPEDIRLELLPIQPFNAENLLPPMLRDWVMDIAFRMSCPPDFVATAAIVSLGSVIGAGCSIKPKKRDNWIVVPNLWGMIVAPPSSKKSPAISEALKPLDRLIAKARKNHQEQTSSFDTEKIVSDARKKVLKKELETQAKNEDGDIDAIANQIITLDQIMPQNPILRRYKSNDITIEKLGEILVENPKGILVLRDELAGFIASWEKQGHEGDRAFYLEGWNGNGSFDTDRIGRGSIFIPNLCVSIFGGTQPDKLLALLRQTTDALANDGAIQRFQMLVYPDPVKWGYVDRIPDKAARDKVYNLLEDLSDLNPVDLGAHPKDDHTEIPYFYFSDEAQVFFKEWTSDLNGNKVPNEDNPLIAEHLGKYDKLFCALALIFHMVDCVENRAVGAVSLEAAKMASAWCEYLEEHSRRCYGLLTDVSMRSAQNLIEHIRKGKLIEGFTLRDVYRKKWSGLKKKDEVQEVLDWLEDTHWIRRYDVETKPNGGRSTQAYKINPKALENRSDKTAST